MLGYVEHAFRAMWHKLLPTAALAVVFVTTHERVRERVIRTQRHRLRFQNVSTDRGFLIDICLRIILGSVFILSFEKWITW